MVSARFIEDFGGTAEYHDAYNKEEEIRERLLEHCLAMGSANRSDRSKGSAWDVFFGKSSTKGADRCRILFTLNTVGAGRGTIMLWETTPPPIHTEGPFPFELFSTHTIERHVQFCSVVACGTGYDTTTTVSAIPIESSAT